MVEVRIVHDIVGFFIVLEWVGFKELLAFPQVAVLDHVLKYWFG